MPQPYADVIGDPIEHSKSPLIHRFWLEKLGMPGDYRAIRVNQGGLPQYLQEKRDDPFWRGCSVTFPLKQAVARAVGDPAHVCAALGATNCVVKSPIGCLMGINTDIDGVGVALKGIELAGKTVVLLGAGGAARAAFCYLSRQGLAHIRIVARDLRKAGTFAAMLPAGAQTRLAVFAFSDAAEAIRGANVVINATPLGMSGQPEMPQPILSALGVCRPAAALDMVYVPTDTPFLDAARGAGARAIGGLTMLVGQAAPAFELFFGAPAPREHDEELKALLAT
jgi:shikimate dehydrogenase